MTADDELTRDQTSKILRFLQAYAPEQFDELIAEYDELLICNLADNHPLGPEDEVAVDRAQISRIYKSASTQMDKTLSLRGELLNRLEREESKYRRQDTLVFGVALIGILLSAIFYVCKKYEDLGYILSLLVALVGILLTKMLDGRAEKQALSKAKITALIDVLLQVQSTKDRDLIRKVLLIAIDDNPLLRPLGGTHRLK